jgi:hypothetical protein
MVVSVVVVVRVVVIVVVIVVLRVRVRETRTTHTWNNPRGWWVHESMACGGAGPRAAETKKRSSAG